MKKLISLLTKVKNTFTNVGEKHISSTTNIEDIEKNKEVIELLLQMQNAMNDQVIKIFNYVKQIAKQHSDHIKTSISRLEEAAMVRIKKTTLSGFIYVDVAPGVKLPVKSVSDIHSAKTYPGELCYISSIKTFCICIAGHVFHGRCGNLINKDKKLLHFKECNKRSGNPERTDFYIDPVFNPLSTHTRNFVNGMLYVPAKKDDTQSFLNIGSADKLASDIHSMDEISARMARDYTFHMLLCMIAYHNVRGSP